MCSNGVSFVSHLKVYSFYLKIINFLWQIPYFDPTMPTWYQTAGYFRMKFGIEFQYSTIVAKPSVYSIITDMNVCQESKGQCDANNEVHIRQRRQSGPIQTSAQAMDDGCKLLTQFVCFFYDLI